MRKLVLEAGTPLEMYPKNTITGVAVVGKDGVLESIREFPSSLAGLLLKGKAGQKYEVTVTDDGVFVRSEPWVEVVFVPVVEPEPVKNRWLFWK